MGKPFLYDYQMDAVNKMKNGCILNGGVGSGKSRTALYYYFKEQGGSMDPIFMPMKIRPTCKLQAIMKKAERLATSMGTSLKRCNVSSPAN